MSAVSNAILRLTIDSSAAKQGAAEFAAATANTKASAAAAAAEADKLNESFRKIILSANAASEAINKISSAGRSFDFVTGKYRTVTQANAEFASGVKLSAFQLNNLSYQIQDVFVQLTSGQSVFRTLTQQLPQAAGAVGGFGTLVKLATQPVILMGAAIAAVVVGFGALVAATESTNRTLLGIQQSFSLTGRSAEFSRAQIRSLIDSTAQLEGVTRSGATAVVQEFARARNLGGKNIIELTKIIGDYAAATRQDVPEAAAQLAKSLKDPVQFAAQLSDQFGGLTLAQYRQIEAAQKSGENNRALSLTIDYLKTTVSGAAKDGMTPLKSAMDDMSNSWSALTQNLANQGWVSKFIGGLAGATKGVADFTSGKFHLDRIDQGIGASATALNKLNLEPDTFWNRLKKGNIQKTLDSQLSTRSDILKDNPSLASDRVYGPNLPEKASSAAQGGVTSIADQSSLLSQFSGIKQQRSDLEKQLKALQTYAAADKTGLNDWAGAIANAQGKLSALKEPLQLANEGLAREADILSKPIAQRDIYRAKIEATSAALNQGIPAQQAYQMGLDAEAKALMTLKAASNDRLTDLSRQIKANDALAVAIAQGPEATVRQQAANDALAESTKNLTTNVKDLTAKNYDLQKSREGASYAAALQQEQNALTIAQQNVALIGTSKDEREKELTLMQKRFEYEQKFGTLGKDRIDELLSLNKRQLELNKSAEQMNVIYDDARKSLSDTFTSVLDGGIRKFSDFSSAVKQIFFKMAAQIAQAMIFTPVINSIMGGGGGSSVLFGNGGVGSGGVAGNSSGGGFLDTIGNIFSSGKSLAGGGSSFSGTSFGTAIDSFGASAFGMGSTAPTTAQLLASPISSASMAGNVAGANAIATGGMSLSSALSGAFSGAGMGAGVGSLMSSLGIGKQGMGSTIGGAIGGVIGSFIPIPIVGPLLGSIVGSLIGGLFGPKKSVGPNGNANLSTIDGRFALGSVGKDNGYDPTAIAQQTADVASKLNSAMDTYGFNVNPQHANWLNTTGYFGLNSGLGNSAKSQDELFVNAFKGLGADGKHFDLLKSPGGAYDTVLKNTKATTADQLIADLNIAKFIEDSKKAATALSTVEQSFKDLSKQADDYVKQADALGIAQKDIYDALIGNFNLQITNAIKQIEDPYQAALDSLIKDQKARLDYATKIGGDTTAVVKLNGLEQQKLVEQFANSATSSLKTMGDNLKKYMDGQVLGATSSLTPYQQFTAAQSQFSSSIDAARTAGKSADIGSVTSAADQLLSLGKSTLGGATAGYSTLEALTRATLQSLGHQLGLPGFATGGSFQVGGSGGTDSQIVAFRATPGENVRVTTPGQSQNDQAGLHMVVGTLQTELRGLRKEMQGVNHNLTRSRNYDLVVRR